MIEDMTVRNLSPATQQSYLNVVSKFGRYFGRSPDSRNSGNFNGERLGRLEIDDEFDLTVRPNSQAHPQPSSFAVSLLWYADRRR